MSSDLIVAHFREDLSWLSRVDKEKFNIVLVSKTQTNASIFQADNVGFEASAYLLYIVQHYDCLPEFCVFVHGHQTSYHHEGDLSCLVNSLPLCATTGYFNFNTFGDFSNACVMFVDEGRCNPMFCNQFATWLQMSPSLFASVGGFPLPYAATFRIRASAQFVVHRSHIQRHSKMQWEGLLHDLLLANKTNDGKACAVIFEYAWCLLMTGWFDEKAWDERAR